MKAIRKRVKAAKKVKRKPVPRADTPGEDPFAPVAKNEAVVKKMGSATAKNCESTISEWLAMRRLDGVEGVVEVLASWHDSNNFYIAMVSPLLVEKCPFIHHLDFIAVIQRWGFAHSAHKPGWPFPD